MSEAEPALGDRTMEVAVKHTIVRWIADRAVLDWKP